MLKAGTILAERYEIVGRVGAGGMADVYKAMDHKLNRYVAVKVMKQEFNEDGNFVTKFRREAQAAAGLANPNIVNVYDVGDDHGSNYFIVMELVEGITLKEYISKKGKLSVREATSIAIQVCMGLASAHAQGITHRDVKPQNIIISTDGKVKVTDFGIARAASSNTISANAMGSVHYSSPEQVRGVSTDYRSDIYSLGITLYEMVTGRVPFDGETTVAIAIKHLQDEMEPPSKYAPDLPYSLEQIIYKCTQKNPDRRYQSMNEVIADLKHSLMDPSGHFVTLPNLADHSSTAIYSDTDRKAIQKAAETGDTGRKTYTSTSSVQQERIREEEENGEGYYTDDEESDLTSKLEKAMTIGGFIVGALIIIVLIYFIARASNFFDLTREDASSGNATEQTSQEGTTGDNEGGESGTEGTAATPTQAASPTGGSTGAETVKVPSIVGLTEETAQAKASERHLGIKYNGEEASDDYPEGTIIRQDPAADADVPVNTTINYWRSSGSASAMVPDVSNFSLSEAEAALQAAGFSNLVTVQAYSNTVGIGNVIATVPAAGENVNPAETEISITVSIGPESPEDVTVQSYGGLSRPLAVKLCEEAGLVVRLVEGSSDRVGTDEVCGQSISSGTVVKQGTEIILTINKPDPSANITDTPSAPTSGGQSQVATVRWVTRSNLGAPSNYNGGAYRLVLNQEVNGETISTTVAEGETISFPYQLVCEGAEGVTSGQVILYEESDGQYVSRVSWPVQFSAES